MTSKPFPPLIENVDIVTHRSQDTTLMREIKTRLWGPEPPKTTTRRDSGYGEEQDEAYRIAKWHYDFQGSRGDFWHNTDLETVRLRKKVFGIVDPTPRQVVLDMGFLDIGPGPLYRSHRQDNTRQNQKKKAKRRKAVLKRHR